MKNTKILILTFVSVLTLANAPRAFAQSIRWKTFPQALELQKKQPRPIVVDVYTTWCRYCTKMDAYTFVNKEVVEYINKHFYAVKFDAESRDPIHFQGKDFAPKTNERTHPLAIALSQGRLSYPTLVYLDEKATLITPMPGYRTPSQLLPVLHYIAEKAYAKGVNFQDFVTEFEKRSQ